MVVAQAAHHVTSGMHCCIVDCPALTCPSIWLTGVPSSSYPASEAAAAVLPGGAADRDADRLPLRCCCCCCWPWRDAGCSEPRLPAVLPALLAAMAAAPGSAIDGRLAGCRSEDARRILAGCRRPVSACAAACPGSPGMAAALCGWLASAAVAAAAAAAICNWGSSRELLRRLASRITCFSLPSWAGCRAASSCSCR